MDIFKLLTRSTNLNKNSSTTVKLPSAGSGAPIVQHQDALRISGQAAGTSKRGAPMDNEPVPISNKARKRLKVEQEHEARQILSPEECLQRLKKHKIKVTLLYSDDQDGTGVVHDERADSRQRRLSAVPRKSHQENLPHDRSATRGMLVQPVETLSSLYARYGLARRLRENLARQAFNEPTEVQMGSLPLLLAPPSQMDRIVPKEQPHASLDSQQESPPKKIDHVDLLAVAPTGSGKTLAFMLPLLSSLMHQRQKITARASQENAEEAAEKDKGDGSSQGDGRYPRAVILAPTRELAEQISNEGKKLAQGTGIKVTLMRKGMCFHDKTVQHGSTDDKIPSTEEKEVQNKNFLVKSDVIVTTPLLFLHSISHKDESLKSSLPDVAHFILDEADVLLDDLFRDQVLAILGKCPNPDLQISMWSATMGSSVEEFATTVILNRRSQFPTSKTDCAVTYRLVRLVVGLKDSAMPKISQRLTYCASEKGKLLALRQILHPTASVASDQPVNNPLQPPFLIFTQTITRAIALHSELIYDIPPAAGGASRIAVLHADLSETARADIMSSFRRAEVWIIITTDLLSRGIDFRGINGVVNYDIPNTAASYIHRVGRTGRQNREGGQAITLYTKEDIPYVKSIANVISTSQRQNQTTSSYNPGKTAGNDGNPFIQQWLLDYLPNITKRTKKELKHKGVAARLDHPAGVDARTLKGMRVSTKSGYDRRKENNKKAAIEASKRRRKQEQDKDQADIVSASDADSWTGFDK